MNRRKSFAIIALIWILIGAVESTQWAGESRKVVRSQMNHSESKEYNQSNLESNGLPIIISFIPSLDSPQEIGMPIGWHVTAIDPDNDTIYFRFWLNGPKTEGKWQILKDWSSDNTCYWRTDEKDIGESNIRVWIRDGKHANLDNMDASKEYNEYQITKGLGDLDIDVVSDIYSDKDRNVYYCPEGNAMIIKNRIYLAGTDIDEVKCVKYFLHESFNQPEGVNGDPNNSFEIWIWAWGGFPIKAVITTKNGEQIERHYLFEFKSKYQDSQKKGIPLVEKCNR